MLYRSNQSLQCFKIIIVFLCIHLICTACKKDSSKELPPPTPVEKKDIKPTYDITLQVPTKEEGEFAKKLVDNSIKAKGGWDAYIAMQNFYLSQDKVFFDAQGNKISSRKDYLYTNIQGGYGGNLFWTVDTEAHSVQYKNGRVDYFINDVNVTDAGLAQTLGSVYYLTLSSILSPFLIKGNSESFRPIEPLPFEGFETYQGIEGRVNLEQAMGMEMAITKYYFDDTELKAMIIQRKNDQVFIAYEGLVEHKGIMLAKKMTTYSIEDEGKRLEKLSEYTNNYGDR